MNDIESVLKCARQFIKPENMKSAIIERYIENEKNSKCSYPVCEKQFHLFENMAVHMCFEHPDLDIDEVYEFLDPIQEYREMYEYKNLTDGDLVTKGEFFGKMFISHNQGLLATIIGKTGSGKSHAALDLGESIAKYVASVKGGKSSDYFGIDNIAIMTIESIIPLMQQIDQKQFNVIILDDVSGSYSQREFNSKLNKNLNKVFTTMRDSNVCLIVTVPDSFMIDKTLRKLAHIRIEMKETYFSQGFTLGRVYKLVEQYGKAVTYRYSIVDKVKHVQYKYIKFEKPSKELNDAYDKKRKEIRMKFTDTILEDIMTGGKAAEEKSKKPEKTTLVFEKLAVDIGKDLETNPNITTSELSRMYGRDRATIRKARAFKIG